MIPKKSKFLGIALIVLLVGSVMPIHISYSMSGFGSNVNLSGSSSPDVGSQKVAVNGNNVYVVWTNAGDVFFTNSTDAGTTFSTPTNISNDTTSSNPQIAVSGNHVYIAWEDTDPITFNHQIFFRNSTDSGVTFSAHVNLSNNTAAYATSPQIVASGNNVYIGWLDDNATAFAQLDVFFKRSINNGVIFDSTPVSLSGPGDFNINLKLAASGSNVYTAWEDTTVGSDDIFFRASADGGATFPTAGINVSNDSSDSKEPSLAATGNDVYLAWSDNSGVGGNYDILYEASVNNATTFNGGSPGTPNNLSSNSGSSNVPQIAASGSNSFVTWQDTRDFASINTDILFKKITSDGTNLSNPVVNLSHDTGGSSVPQIAISSPNLYVVWQDDTLGNNEIFFRSSEDSGSNFGGLQNLSDDSGLSQMPQVYSTSTNSYVVWNDDTGGPTGVFFKLGNVIPIDVKFNSIQYRVNDTAIITVKDSSKMDGTASEVIPLNITTTTMPTGIELNATESGDTGVFSGNLTITNSIPSTPSTIQATGGDTIKATYNAGGYGFQSTIASILPTIVAFDFHLYDRGSHAHVTVTDQLANTDPGTVQTIPVKITSSANPAGITLFLNETGIDTGIFGGTLDAQSNIIFAVNSTGEIPIERTLTVIQPYPTSNTNSTKIETVNATVQSTSDPCPCPPGGMIFNLTETGPDTGVFTAKLKVTAGPTSNSSGIIHASPGDILSISNTGLLTTNSLITPNPKPSTGIIQVIAPNDTITASYQGLASSASVQNAFGEGGAGGGIVRAGLVLDATASLSGKGGNNPIPPLFDLSAFATRPGQLPDDIREKVLNQNFSAPLSPVFDTSFDYPLIIDGGGYILGGYSNTIKTITANSGVPVDLKLNLPATGLEHLALYTNLNDKTRELQDSDTYIIYDKGQSLQKVDPHGYFASVKFDIDTEGSKNKIEYKITFAKPMKKSDIIFRAWNDRKSTADVKLLDVWQIVEAPQATMTGQVSQPNILQSPPVVPIPQVTKSTPPSPDLLSTIKDWGGYSTHSISDSEFLSDLGLTGNTIPKWVSNTAKYVVSNDLTPQDFETIIKYLTTNGIIN